MTVANMDFLAESDFLQRLPPIYLQSQGQFLYNGKKDELLGL